MWPGLRDSLHRIHYGVSWFVKAGADTLNLEAVVKAVVTVPIKLPMVEPRIVDIPLSLGDFQAANMLMSYVLYPGIGPEHEPNRVNAERAIGLEALRRRENQRKGPLPDIKVPSHYFRQSDAERKRFLAKIHTEFSKRLSAAQIALPLILQIFAKDPLSLEERLKAAGIPQPLLGQLTAEQRLILVKGGKPVQLTIEKLAEKHFKDTESSNGQARTLRPSYPVLHMAVVLELTLSTFTKSIQPSPSIYDFPFTPTASMLLAAKLIGDLIPLVPKLQGAARQLIQFRAT
jgi:hypothetical protein